MLIALSFSARAKSRRGLRAKDPMLDPICLRCWIDSVPGREGCSSFCDWRRGGCWLLSFMMIYYLTAEIWHMWKKSNYEEKSLLVYLSLSLSLESFTFITIV